MITIRRARSEHRCAWCSEPIAAGEEYAEVGVITDRGPRRTRYHLDCDAWLTSPDARDAIRAMEDGEHWPHELAVRGGLREES